jgi:hypothetical protein
VADEQQQPQLKLLPLGDVQLKNLNEAVVFTCTAPSGGAVSSWFKGNAKFDKSGR